MVSATQWEFGALVVIVTILLPAFGGVALLTLVAIFATMNIIQLMATATLIGCPFVLVAGVTEDAAHLQVFSGQLVTCLAVVKLGIAPALFAVALGTLFSKAVFVNVTRLMTIDTF